MANVQMEFREIGIEHISIEHCGFMAYAISITNGRDSVDIRLGNTDFKLLTAMLYKELGGKQLKKYLEEIGEGE